MFSPELEAAVANAEANLAAMASDYEEWAADDLSDALMLARRLRAMPHRTAADIFELCDLLHNIKGQGGTFGYRLLSKIAHVSCRVLRDQDSIDDHALRVIERFICTMQLVLSQRIQGMIDADGQVILRNVNASAAPYLATPLAVEEASPISRAAA